MRLFGGVGWSCIVWLLITWLLHHIQKYLDGCRVLKAGQLIFKPCRVEEGG